MGFEPVTSQTLDIAPPYQITGIGYKFDFTDNGSLKIVEDAQKIQDNIITIIPVEEDISAAFGLLKATKTVSLEQMDAAVIESACDD